MMFYTDEDVCENCGSLIYEEVCRSDRVSGAFCYRCAYECSECGCYIIPSKEEVFLDSNDRIVCYCCSEDIFDNEARVNCFGENY